MASTASIPATKGFWAPGNTSQSFLFEVLPWRIRKRVLGSAVLQNLFLAVSRGIRRDEYIVDAPLVLVNCRFLYCALHGLPWTVFRGHARTSTYLADTVRTLANISGNFTVFSSLLTRQSETVTMTFRKAVR